MAEVYYLESVEQLRAIAGELRERILEPLTRNSMTVTQLGELLGEAPAKIHYHVRELERVGLVKLVETREKGGILEKYYRAVADSFLVPANLLRTTPPDESIAALGDFLQRTAQGFMQAFSKAIERQAESPQKFSVARSHAWLTSEEFLEVMQKIHAVLQPYEDRRGIDGEAECTFTLIAHPTRTGAVDEGAPTTAETLKPVEQSEQASTRRVIVAGGLTYSRQDLERVIERGESLDITSLGYFSIAEDVSVELVDRAISRFRHRGAISASPEVQEALKQKKH